MTIDPWLVLIVFAGAVAFTVIWQCLRDDLHSWDEE